MLFEDLYINYFRHQATNHPDLVHIAQEGEQIFDVIDIEQGMLVGLRSGVKPDAFMMRLFHYTYRIGLISGEMRKIIQGGFMLAKQFSVREDDAAEYRVALREAERVTDEIIEKMLADSQAGHPLFYYSLDRDQDITVITSPKASGTSYAAKICTFSFSQHWRNCIDSPDAPAWLDDGLTPHDL